MLTTDSLWSVGDMGVKTRGPGAAIQVSSGPQEKKQECLEGVTVRIDFQDEPNGLAAPLKVV